MSNYGNQYATGPSGNYSEPLPPMSGMAIGALVLGIISTICGVMGLGGSLLSVACCCAAPAMFAAPLAILLGIGGGVLGYFAMQECKTTGKRGHGMALAGIITSAVGFVFGAIFVLIVVAFAGFAAVNQPPNQFNNNF